MKPRRPVLLKSIMEKTYKILKAIVLVLAIAVIAAGIWRFVPSEATQSPAETTLPAENTAPANPAPDFTVYDIDGNPVTLSDFAGQPVVLNFWTSWCGPCKREMPSLEQAYLEYGNQVQFLIIDLADGRSETVEIASDYIAQQGYTFPVYYDTNMSTAKAYGITSVPMTCFISSNGTLIDSHVGVISPEKLRNNIDSLLN